MSLIFKFRTAQKDKSRRNYLIYAADLCTEHVATETHPPCNYTRSKVFYIALNLQLKVQRHDKAKTKESDVSKILRFPESRRCTSQLNLNGARYNWSKTIDR